MDTTKKRIEYLDLAKGIGILLVVWAHAKAPGTPYIYEMHMPFFFIISGLLYNAAKPLGPYIKSKVLSLYIPFIFWNCIFYTTKSLMHGVPIRAIITTNVKILLTLDKDGQFFGATWFLGALFVTSVVYKIIDVCLKDSKYKPFIMVAIFSAIGIFGFVVTLDFMLSRVCVLSMFFSFGVFVKHFKEQLKVIDGIILAIISAIIFLIIGRYNYNGVNMGMNQYRSPVLFCIGAVAASYTLLYLCRKIEFFSQKFRILEIIKNVMTFFGKKSLDILIWQFNAFRVIIVLQMYIYKDPITLTELWTHYPVYVTTNGWWFLYTVAGMILPIILCSILRAKPLGYITKKLHIV